MRICITGAAGNLGGLLAEYLVNTSENELNLLTHKTPVSPLLQQAEQANIFKADLADKESLYSCLDGVDSLIHFAGVLFKANPEKFLPATNVQYFKNLCDAAVKQNVKRIVLVSFPHVEGETTPDNPATGRLDCTPISAHAATRLEEEKYLINIIKNKGIETVVLRVGMVYGKGILMIDAARWFARYNLLGVWKKPTIIHLISKDDFLESSKTALIKESLSGIYHIGDEGVLTLQEFLKIATKQWSYKKPWIMPDWLIYSAACFFEMQSALLGTREPLTKDFITIGKVSYYGDTGKMRSELLPKLKYRTIEDGKETL